MKLTFFSFLLFAIFTPQLLQAQSRAEISSFDASGIRVILKKVPKEVVAVRMYVRGGTSNYPRDKEGVEELAFELAMFGRAGERSARQIAERANEYGIGFSSKSGYDYGYLGMTAVKKYWNESWDLWATAVGSPALSENDFENVRDKVYSRIRNTMGSQENYLDQLSMTVAFGGTDYEKIPEGSSETLFDITLEEVQEHYTKVLTKANCFIVVVGDIDEADLKSKVEEYFSGFPEGNRLENQDRGTVKNSGVTIQHRDLEVNHIQGRMPAPNRWSDEGIHNMLAMSIFSDRLTDELRNERELSYNPSAFPGNELRYAANSIYFSTISPVNALEVVVAVLDRIRAEGFTEAELAQKKNPFLTFQYLAQETTDAQAHVLGDAEAAGDWQLALGFTEAVRQTTLEDINSVFSKYNDKISWAYLGNESQVLPSDFPQPESLDGEEETKSPEEVEETESPAEETGE